ncbi:MAG: hypothetical protein HY905_17120 [Deltaproteobacteria bacterium]|nr:hypothetical protein [Deltaproteobacteria bacterium]
MSSRVPAPGGATVQAGPPADAPGRTDFGRLRSKLRWQLLVAYVTPLLLLAAYFHYAYVDMMQESIRRHLVSVAENQRNTVDLFLRERVSGVRRALYSGMLTFPPGPGVMDRLLEEMRTASRTFVDVGLFSPDGKLVAYAGPETSLVGRDYSSQAWFTRIRQEPHDSVISDVYLGFRGKPHFIVAVRQSTDHAGWVLRASVDPESFAEFVASSYLLADAEAFIVNVAGQRQTLRDAGAVASEPVDPGSRTAETVASESTTGGTDYLRVVAWLTENEWALVVQVPRDRAYAPIAQTRLIVTAIVLVALLVIVGVVLRSTRKLVAQLEAAIAAQESLRHQLFNAAKLASVGEMAAGVAHEINNPLAIIYEEASMMTDTLDPELGGKPDLEDFKERLDAIRDAVKRGRTITSKLLAFARRHDPDPEPSDLNLLVSRVLMVKEHEYSLANIEIAREFAPDLPRVMVNRNLLDQVVLNLLNNAHDAIVARGCRGRLSLRTTRREDGATLEIGDNGCGMTPEVMAKIFFPFFTTKGVGKGTGLGLSISHGIIESFGGRIDVRSRVDEGSTFTIFLPAAPADASAGGTAEKDGRRGGAEVAT